MKKLILLLALTIGVNSYSQNYASSLGLSGGYAEDGIGILATYNYHLNKFNYAQVSVFASIAEDKEGVYDIPYNIFTVQPGMFFNVWEQSRFKKYKINIGGGGIIGYEVFNNGNNELENGAVIDGKSKFIYGAYAGAEFEIYINNEWALLVKANEYFHANSDVGQFYLYAGVGLRYFLF